MSDLAIRFQELTEKPRTEQYQFLISVAAEFRLTMDDALNLFTEWEKAAKY